MALTRAQIDVLRFAQTDTALIPTSKGLRPNPKLRIKGAAAMTVIRALQRRGLLNTTGKTTENGNGKLLQDPQASSDPPSVALSSEAGGDEDADEFPDDPDAFYR